MYNGNPKLGVAAKESTAKKGDIRVSEAASLARTVSAISAVLALPIVSAGAIGWKSICISKEFA